MLIMNAKTMKFAANKPTTLNKKTDLNINPNSEAYRVSKDPNTDLNIQKV